jgi:hypothetical protein
MATPSKKKRRTGAQLAADGFAALVEKLGVPDAIRYVQLFSNGEGNYTTERHQWMDSLGHEEVSRLMAKAEKQRARRKQA